MAKLLNCKIAKLMQEIRNFWMGNQVRILKKGRLQFARDLTGNFLE